MKYYILVIVLLLCSCSDVDNLGVYEVKVPAETNQKEVLLSAFVENIRIVPLDMDDECPISQIDKVKIFKDEIYILDKTNNAIYIYGMDGKHLRTYLR